MPKLKIKTSFPYYHKGYERKDYVEGEEVDTEDDEFVTVSTGEGWAEIAGAPAPAPAPAPAEPPAPEPTEPPAAAPAPAAAGKKAK
nr:hypothetical protein [uncultured Roseateles sp.]